MRIRASNIVAYYTLILYESLVAVLHGCVARYYWLTSWQDATGRRVDCKQSAASAILSIASFPWGAIIWMGSLGDVPVLRERFRLRPYSQRPSLLKQVPAGNSFYLQYGRRWAKTLLKNRKGDLLETGFYSTTSKIRARTRRVLLEERLRERYGIGLPTRRRPLVGRIK